MLALHKQWILSNIKPIGIMPEECMQQQDLQQSDHWEMDNSTNLDDFCSIVPIYHTFFAETTD